MAERVVTPSGQRHFIEPYDQRVFQFDTDKSDVFLSRVANSIYQVLGNDIVMYGLEIDNLAHTADSIILDLGSGAAIQDQTLIVTEENTPLEVTGVSSMDEAGRLVVMSNYNYLETFEQNKHSFNINYIDVTGSPFHDFMPQRDRIVLAILQFTKDASDNVTGVSFAPDPFITIEGNVYYVKGYSAQNKRLTAYLIHQLLSGGGSGGDTSIRLDPLIGLQLINDLQTPGNLKFYGTNQIGSKGWYDISTLSVDNESDLVDYQGQFNQVLYNGNLFFIAAGHRIDYELFPFWQIFTSDQQWSPTPAFNTIWESGNQEWRSTAGDAQLQLRVASGGLGVWANGYRPLKMKIETIQDYGIQDPIESNCSIILQDVSGNVIGNVINGLHEDEEILLDFSGADDIVLISFLWQVPAIAHRVKGIQFFGGTPGGLV